MVDEVVGKNEQTAWTKCPVNILDCRPKSLVIHNVEQYIEGRDHIVGFPGVKALADIGTIESIRRETLPEVVHPHRGYIYPGHRHGSQPIPLLNIKAGSRSEVKNRECA